MHLISAQAEAKLKANRFAWEHFGKFKGTYVTFARKIRDAMKGYERINEESRVDIVTHVILQMDPDIWGLAKDGPLSAEQIAECYARMVVGHEDEG